MDAERPEIERAEDGSDGDSRPTLSLWRAFLVFLAGTVPLALMARGLYLALDLPKDTELVRPALFIVAVAAMLARPRTFRQIAIVAAAVVVAGAGAMVCYLPVALFTLSFEVWSLGFMLRLLAMVLVIVLGLWIVRLACRRLAVPWSRETPAKDQF